MAPVILLLFFLDRAYGTRTLLAIGLITTALSFDKWWAVWPPLSNNLYAFVLGMLIPTLGRDWVTRLSRRTAHYLLLAALIVLFGAGPALGFYSRPTAVFETYAAVALLSIVTFHPDIRGVTFLDHWAVRLLGASSGSYYVLHMPLIPLLVLLAAAVVPPAWSEQFPVLVGTGVIALSLCALVPVCLLSYRLVEATGIAVGRRVLQRRKLVAAPSAA